MMADTNGNHIDPNAGLCIIHVSFNPLNGHCNFQTRNIPNHITALGMLEMAKQFYLQSQKQKEGPQIAVPVGMGPVGRA